MVVIRVPKPRGKYDPDRPVSSLLLTQIQHMHEAEKNLPPRYHSDIYMKAIRTEGEAAAYIRDVTEAIHTAHMEAAAQRARRGMALAATAESEPTARRAGTTKPRKSRAKGGRKGGPKT
jgi:hypothetical protein